MPMDHEIPASLLDATAFMALEQVINNALKCDLATRKKLIALHGKAIEIKTRQPKLRLVIIPNQQGLQLSSLYDGPIDCQLEGEFFSLLKLVRAKDKTSTLMSNQINISGDSQLARQLQELIAQLDIDWETPLAKLIGDVATHQLSQFLRSCQQWLSHSHHSLVQDIEEYIHEESRLLPQQQELEIFYQQVDEIKLTLDRLEARVQRLLNQC